MNTLPVLPVEQPPASIAEPPAATSAENPVKKPEPPTEEVVEKAKDAVVPEAVKPAAETATKPVTEAAKDPVIEKAVEPVIEQTKDPVVEAAVEKVTEQVKEPVIDQALEQLVRRATQPVVEQAIEELKRQTTAALPISRQANLPQPVVDQLKAFGRQETIPPPVVEQLARQVTLPAFIAEDLARKETLPQQVVDQVTEVLIRQATSEVQPAAQPVHEEQPSGEQKADDWTPVNPKKTNKAVRNIVMNIAKPQAKFQVPAIDPKLAKAIVTPLGMLARNPAPVFCPSCNKTTMTGINVQTGHCTCPGTSPKSVQHSCGECGTPLATWFRFGETAIHAGAKDLLAGKLPGI
ncbi:hypothetical protein K490DRAFT_59252 [Saccharata proteae CBS 121410]|uniref:LITAF domain-containing protein n=1 Tax=Saccharata proteae CBS 121410 TaxID=1314787 RepID=A0A9P4HN79_9PEZI|nr:hypothetical protein K490DRAFT_59252 [Saccharata proteae CBS 121410]